MSLGVSPRSTLSRDLGLLAWQVRYEQRAFWRNRTRGVLTFIFPVMFLVIFASLDKGAHIKSLGGIPYDAFLVPGILAYAVISTTFFNMAISTATLRDDGVLKRMQGTPLPQWTYIGARMLSSGLLMLVLAVVVIIGGVVIWGLQLRVGAIPGLIVSLLLGAAAFTTLGIGLVRFIRNAETAPVIINLLVFPLTFISDIWFPTGGLPSFLRTIASIFPIKALANCLQYVFSPLHHGAGFDGSALLTLLVWTAIGTWLMARFLRVPLGDHVK